MKRYKTCTSVVAALNSLLWTVTWPPQTPAFPCLHQALYHDPVLLSIETICPRLKGKQDPNGQISVADMLAFSPFICNDFSLKNTWNCPFQSKWPSVSGGLSDSSIIKNIDDPLQEVDHGGGVVEVNEFAPQQKEVWIRGRERPNWQSLKCIWKWAQFCLSKLLVCGQAIMLDSNILLETLGFTISTTAPHL